MVPRLSPNRLSIALQSSMLTYSHHSFIHSFFLLLIHSSIHSFIGEPNSIGGDEDCVVLDLSGADQFDNPPKWKDYPCCKQNRIQSVLCAKPLFPKSGGINRPAGK